MHAYDAALCRLGVFLFAITLTLAAIMWMKALQHEWFSTMYGVYYFAGSMWITIATVYVITLLLKRQGPLREVVHEKTYYFIGSMLFAFTVFYAYITFCPIFHHLEREYARRKLSGTCCAKRALGGTSA